VAFIAMTVRQTSQKLVADLEHFQNWPGGFGDLPPWLSYDPVAQNFTASDVPAGIQALNLVISQGNQT